MRYYWEVLFSTEYFPYWEFTMLMMLALNISILCRLHRVEKKIDDYDGILLFHSKLMSSLNKKIEMAEDYKAKVVDAVKKLKYTRRRVKQLVIDARDTADSVPSYSDFNPIKIVERATLGSDSVSIFLTFNTSSISLKIFIVFASSLSILA